MYEPTSTETKVGVCRSIRMASERGSGREQEIFSISLINLLIGMLGGLLVSTATMFESVYVFEIRLRVAVDSVSGGTSLSKELKLIERSISIA